MPKLIMENAGTLKSSMGAMSSVLDEIDFEFGGDGLKAEGMDSSHVALVRFSLSPEAFQSFSTDDDLVFGLDLNRADEVFSRAKSRDRIELEVSDDGAQLTIVLRGENARRFELPLMDPVDEELPDLSLNNLAEAELQAGLVKGALKDAKLVDDNVRIGFSEGQFSMSAESNNKSFAMDVSGKADAVKSLDVESDLENMYNIGDLEDGLKSVGSSEVINLHTGEEVPIVAEMDLADGCGEFTFVLAPRVERG